jgi:putative polyketide hydroxylase
MARPGREKVSTLDLFTGAFTLLVAPDGGEWAAAARTVATSLDVELDIHHIGIALHDPEDQFPGAYGITGSGTSLVRPDGFIAWRASVLTQQPEHDLEQVLTQLLAT